MYRLFILVSISLIVFFSSAQVYAQEPKLATFQETAQLIIDQSISNNVTVAISLQSTSNQEIRIPTELAKKIQENKKVLSVIITSEEQCVLGVPIDESCIMINMSVEGIEGGIKAIQDTGRLIGDSLINDINNAVETNAKFHSVFLNQRDETNRALGTSGVISGQGTFSAVYTMPREDSQTMYEKFSAILLPSEIRNSGGFYDLAKKLSAEQNAGMTLSIIPHNKTSLFQLKLSVDYPNTARGIKNISPLEFFKINELKRSDYFSKDFYPLNSLLKVVLLSAEPLKVSDVNTKIVPDVIRDGQRLPEFTTDGWFFDQESGKKIEATYLFGKKFSVGKDELVFTVSSLDGTNGNEINTPSNTAKIDSFQIVILVGIVIAAVGASIYYMKGFRVKH
ncbi:MAG: hypothetical protein ACREAU_03285 [Nitrosopumilaceae archaeon]